MTSFDPGQPWTGSRQRPPSFSRLTPDSILDETRALLLRSRKFRDRLVAAISPATATFQNVVVPLMDESNATSCRLSILAHLLADASPDPEIREASRQAQELSAAAEIVQATRKDVAELVDAVFQRSVAAGHESLDREDVHMLRVLHGRMTCSGSTIQSVHLRERLHAAQLELQQLCTAAQKTMSDSDDGVWFSRDELEGMSPAVLNALQTRDDDRDGTSMQVQHRVTFRDDHLSEILGRVQSSASRRTYMVAYRRRFPENVARLNQIISLRDEIARILRFQNHASMKMQDRMARDIEEVHDTLNGIASGLESLARAEDQELLQYIRGQEPAWAGAHVDDWDWRYYTGKFSARSRKFDQGKLAEYFEIGHTWPSILKVYERMFELHFCEISGTAEVWHDSVRVYSVWDAREADRQFLGYLYADLFERDGKYPNAHTARIEPSYVAADCRRNYPSSALICSFPEPSASKPTLLKHLHLRILFHELGHCIHHLVAKTKYALSHSRDFVEIPSRLLEYWSWQPDILQSIARHYTCVDEAKKSDDEDERGDGKLLREMLEELQESRSGFRASPMMGVVHRAVFDLRIHSPASHQEALDMDVTALWNTLSRDMGCQRSDPADWGWGQAAFGPIFRNYDAGYYAYVTATAYAADIFATAFGGNHRDKDKLRLWREQVLELGSSIPEMQILEGFLGRKLDPGPFLREMRANSCANVRS